MTDWTQDPQAQEWIDHVRTELVPMIDASAYGIQIVPDQPDVKAAVELGFMILLDKPIVAVAFNGVPIPAALRRVADEVVEISDRNLNDPAVSARIRDALQRTLDRHDR